jgi:uncharacterized protein (TIGR02271 family)
MEMLKSAGINAHIADKGAIQAFRNTGLEAEVTRLYESRMDEGNIIVMAHPRHDSDDAMGIMLNSGAEYINLSDGPVASDQQAGQASAAKINTSQSTGAARYANMKTEERQYGRGEAYTAATTLDKDAGETNIRLHDETLTPVKQSAHSGEVQLHKIVHETEEQVPVTLRHEEVNIERRAVDRPADGAELDSMNGETISVPVYEERAELQKQTRVREEVGISK